MSPAPNLGSVAEEFLHGLEPLASRDPENEYATALLLEALGRMWQDVDDLIRDTQDGPGWSVLVDVDRAPGWALPWLGQLAGVRVTAGASEALQRAEVRRADGQSRGLAATIIDTIRPYLEEPRRADLFERYRPDSSADEPYHLTARVRYADLPAGGEADAIDIITRRFMAAIPAGIIGHILFEDTRTYNELNSTYATYDAVDAGFATYDAMLTLGA